jgi:hypothetical protein
MFFVVIGVMYCCAAMIEIGKKLALSPNEGLERLVSPWEKQLIDDMKELNTVLGNMWDIDGETERHGIHWMWRNEWKEWFVVTEPSVVRKRKDTERGRREYEGVPMMKCECLKVDGTRCQYEGTKNKVITHRLDVHKLQQPVNRLAICNQCYKCGNLFKSRWGAVKHAQDLVANGECNGTHPRAWEPERPTTDRDQCPVCDQRFRTAAEAVHHMGTHLEELRLKVENEGWDPTAVDSLVARKPLLTKRRKLRN